MRKPIRRNSGEWACAFLGVCDIWRSGLGASQAPKTSLVLSWLQERTSSHQRCVLQQPGLRAIFDLFPRAWEKGPKSAGVPEAKRGQAQLTAPLAARSAGNLATVPGPSNRQMSHRLKMRRARSPLPRRTGLRIFYTALPFE